MFFKFFGFARCIGRFWSIYRMNVLDVLNVLRSVNGLRISDSTRRSFHGDQSSGPTRTKKSHHTVPPARILHCPNRRVELRQPISTRTLREAFSPMKPPGPIRAFRQGAARSFPTSRILNLTKIVLVSTFSPRRWADSQSDNGGQRNFTADLPVTWGECVKLLVDSSKAALLRRKNF